MQPPSRRSPCRPTSRRASTSSPVPRRTWRSTSSITWTTSRSRPPRSLPVARTRRVRRWCASARPWGSRGIPSSSSSAREEYRRRHAPGPTNGAPAAAPLFALDQNEFETSLAADHVNVEETARKVSRRDGRAGDRCDRRGAEAAHRGHGPDGVLRLLPAAPAHAARPPRGDRGEPVAGGARPPVADRRGDAGHRPLRRPAASARGARDEARPAPPGADDGDHRRDAVRGGEARAASVSTTRPTARRTCGRTPRCSR